MPRFVCSECGAKLEGGDYVLISRARSHVIDKHNKIDVTNEYVRDRMFSRA